MTLEEYYDWFKANVPESHWKESGNTPTEALDWMACFWEAEDMIDDFTTKDLAEYLQDGQIGPWKFMNFWEGLDQEDIEDLKKNTLQFFGVGR